MVVLSLAAGKQSVLLPVSLSRTCRPQRPALSIFLAFLLPAILLASGCGSDDSNSTRTPTPAVTETPTASPTSSPTPTPTSTSAASVINFSPEVVTLNNPTTQDPITSAAGRHLALAPIAVTVDLTAYDSKGNILPPTVANPIHVHVYGAPDGMITPIDTLITSGNTVNFNYNGGFFHTASSLRHGSTIRRAERPWERRC
jgi:hypothetical protein